MVNRNERYWKNKEERAAAAKNHLAYVSEKYKEEIREQVANTVMYDAIRCSTASVGHITNQIKSS